MDVLRDTHRALVPRGDLVDFHPIYPPWARVAAGGQPLGELQEPSWPEQVRAAEDGMREVVRRGLFRLIAEQTHDLHEHYEDADELIEVWEAEISPELEHRVRVARGRLQVVETVVFRLYRAV